ncbi:hypothetical protein AB6A40_001717 [Gnathostoma spinigerum]|uniref:long-chain-fatty-acid--CoA ligase n=1 Tax=Gnathostoma spinigerum TaxID=75299 RepID=A0ABD6E4T4_9BILA
MLSFLPLAHVFQHSMEMIAFAVGARVGYYSGDIRNLPDDCKILKPTVIVVVPRILNRIYDKVVASMKGSLVKRAILNLALAIKMFEVRRGVIRNDTIFDHFVFSKVREGFGGRARVFACGGAPLASHVMNFVRAALGCYIVEGYGQTECAGMISLCIETETVPCVAGVPIFCDHIKLSDASNLGYETLEQGGEICVKGANVFKGYFHNDELTKETIDAEGWMHTGDIGKWTENGVLQIIDRVKNIFKLSQGEYIAPEKVENVYMQSRLVSQVFLHGESLKTCTIAVVVPEEEELVRIARQNLGLQNLTMNDLCANKKVKQMVMEDMLQVGRTAGLNKLEQVKDIILTSEPFSIKNGLLTPTLKNRRPYLRRHFAKDLKEMYENLP